MLCSLLAEGLKFLSMILDPKSMGKNKLVKSQQIKSLKRSKPKEVLQLPTMIQLSMGRKLSRQLLIILEESTSWLIMLEF